MNCSEGNGKCCAGGVQCVASSGAVSVSCRPSIKTARCQCCGDSVLLDASLTVALEAAVMATCCLWPRP